MKARVSDTFVKDSLGNSALIRSETKTVLIASEFNRHVKRRIEVYYISSKIPKPKFVPKGTHSKECEEEVEISIPEFTQSPSLVMFGRLTDIAGKWNGKEE